MRELWPTAGVFMDLPTGTHMENVMVLSFQESSGHEEPSIESIGASHCLQATLVLRAGKSQ